MMKYKGYMGEVSYDAEAKIFHGDVVGIRGSITFEGRTVEEIEQAFKDSIDDYLEFCKSLNQEPEKPFSGNFSLRVSPEQHLALYQAAQSVGTSINKFVTHAALQAASNYSYKVPQEIKNSKLKS